jgi:hypothetical protein
VMSAQPQVDWMRPAWGRQHQDLHDGPGGAAAGPRRDQGSVHMSRPGTGTSCA